jgi:hypothetical protein
VVEVKPFDGGDGTLGGAALSPRAAPMSEQRRREVVAELCRNAGLDAGLDAALSTGDAADAGGGWWRRSDHGGKTHREALAAVLAALQDDLALAAPRQPVAVEWLAQAAVKRYPALFHADHLRWPDFLKEVAAVCRDYGYFRGGVPARRWRRR